MPEQVSSLKTGVKYKDTPIGKIPVDWEVVRLEDVCDEIYRYPTYYNIKYVEQDGVPEVRGELIKTNGELCSDPSEYRYISKETSANFPRTILDEGDFVLSVRGTMGKVGYIARNLENANMTANLMRISPNRNKVYPLWLKQFFLSDFFQNSLDQASSATTIKTIKAPELKAIDLALPSLSEQKKIADILTSVDETIGKTDQIIEKTKEVKKGLMQKLLSHGIGHKKFKKTEIGEIPEEWRLDLLGNLVSIKHGYAFKSEYFGDQGPILLTPGNFNEDGGLYFTEGNLKRYSGSYPQEFSFSPNDLVVVMTDLSPFCKILGNPALLPSDEMVLHNQRIGKVVFKSDRIDKEFLYFFFLSKQFKQEIKSTATGSTVRHTAPDRIHGVKLALPPIEEQQRIAEILSSVDHEIEEEANQKGQLEVLKKGLMQVLLTGKIRVRT